MFGSGMKESSQNTMEIKNIRSLQFATLKLTLQLIVTQSLLLSVNFYTQAKYISAQTLKVRSLASTTSSNSYQYPMSS